MRFLSSAVLLTLGLGVVGAGVSVGAQAVTIEQHEAAMKQVYEILGRQHHFEADDKDALFIWDTLDGSELVEHIFSIMTMFFGAVALMLVTGEASAGTAGRSGGITAPAPTSESNPNAPPNLSAYQYAGGIQS